MILSGSRDALSLGKRVLQQLGPCMRACKTSVVLCTVRQLLSDRKRLILVEQYLRSDRASFAVAVEVPFSAHLAP